MLIKYYHYLTTNCLRSSASNQFVFSIFIIFNVLNFLITAKNTAIRILANLVENLCLSFFAVNLIFTIYGVTALTN